MSRSPVLPSQDPILILAPPHAGDNTVTLMLGNGDRAFIQASGSPIPVGKQPASRAVSNFNGSGRLGLSVSNAGDSTVSVLAQR